MSPRSSPGEDRERCGNRAHSTLFLILSLFWQRSETSTIQVTKPWPSLWYLRTINTNTNTHDYMVYNKSWKKTEFIILCKFNSLCQAELDVTQNLIQTFEAAAAPKLNFLTYEVSPIYLLEVFYSKKNFEERKNI